MASSEKAVSLQAQVSIASSALSVEETSEEETIKPPTFENGQLVDDKFVVCKKVNEGGFGAVYEVSLSDLPDSRYALKLALTKDTETEQLVRMEVGLLRRLSKQNPCFPHFYQTGAIDGFPYLVMDLLGLSLSKVQMRMPDEKFTIKTVVRIGLQIIDAIEAIHSYHFIHRDIKPGNMAIGLNPNQRRQVYLFDFGLSRRYVQQNSTTGELDMKPERSKAPFRGTYHYCSLQQHRSKDFCRRDDLWAFMYTLIELASGYLPWEEEDDKIEIERMKQETPISVLLEHCPPSFAQLLSHLDTLEFLDKPSYDLFRTTFSTLLSEMNLTEEDMYDWEIHPIDGEITGSGSYYTTTCTETPLTSEYSSYEGSSGAYTPLTNSLSAYTASITNSQTESASSSTKFSSIFTGFSSSSVSTMSG